MSFMVMSPLRLKSLSTTRSFSILCLWRIFFDSSRLMPSLTVTRFSFVMTFFTFSSRFVSNRRSLLVMMPTSFFPFVTGIPEIWYFAMRSKVSLIFWSGEMVMGSTIIPLSDFLTFSTSWACSATPIFLWMMPIPPSWARQIAVFDSVTVSMAALRMGICSRIEGVRGAETSTSAGMILLEEGASRTSSNVSPSWKSYGPFPGIFHLILVNWTTLCNSIVYILMRTVVYR